MDRGEGLETGNIPAQGIVRLVLTSDGIHGALTQDRILAALRGKAPLDEAVLRDVLEAALAAGSRDNLSLAVIDL